VIDIIRDYTAIGMGAAQATGGRVVSAGLTGAGSAVAWTASTVAEIRQDPLGSVGRAPTMVATHVHGGLDRAAGWMGSASGAQVRALRRHVGQVEQRLAGLRGER
jgi:hypothetical protein